MKQTGLVILSLLSVWMVSAQTYSIGDVYTAPDGSQGIVYYLSPDGTGGWVVALTDASEGCAWGNNTDVPQLTNLGTSDYTNWYMNYPDGYVNTQILRNYHNNSEYAAGVVDFENGWVLPTIRQMRTLCSNLALVWAPLLNAGGTVLAEGPYWCCMEYSADEAWVLEMMYWGQMSTRNKTELSRVRAVRSFSYQSDNPSTEYSVLWSTGATTPTITVTPEETTTYTVTVTEVGADCVGTGEITIEVLSNGPVVTVVATDDTICEGDEVMLRAVLLNAGVYMPVPPIAVGDILCTDNSTVKPYAWPVAGKTATGIVCYVDNTGQHGWAIHLNEQGVMPWSTAQSGNIPNAIIRDTPAEAISDYNGSYNTLAIRSVTNTSLYPAAMAVDYDNGWYLPASGQLYLMYPLMPILNESLAVCGGTPFDLNASWYYCSSSVAVARNMWSLDYYGYIIHYLPTIDYHVRSMRDF